MYSCIDNTQAVKTTELKFMNEVATTVANHYDQSYCSNIISLFAFCVQCYA